MYVYERVGMRARCPVCVRVIVLLRVRLYIFAWCYTRLMCVRAFPFVLVCIHARMRGCSCPVLYVCAIVYACVISHVCVIIWYARMHACTCMRMRGVACTRVYVDTHTRTHIYIYIYIHIYI